MWRFLFEVPEGYELIEKPEYKKARLEKELLALEDAVKRYNIRIKEIKDEMKEGK